MNLNEGEGYEVSYGYSFFSPWRWSSWLGEGKVIGFEKGTAMTKRTAVWGAKRAIKRQRHRRTVTVQQGPRSEPETSAERRGHYGFRPTGEAYEILKADLPEGAPNIYK